MTIELRRVESKEPENTVPFDAWNTRNFKPEYLAEWKAPFIKRKNRTLTALSDFREFLKNKHSLESLNTIFRIRSPKGIFGQNMSDLPNGLLCITAMINVFLNIHTFKLLHFKRREEGKWVEIEGIRNNRVRATMGQITFTKKNNLY